MKETKKQQYIPRAALLRRFSNTRYNDDKKNELMCYDKKEKTTRKSNLYKLAFENNLYEDPDLPKNFLEESFSEFEREYVIIFDSIEKICMNQQNCNALVLSDVNEKRNLKFAIVHQFLRTPKIKENSEKDEFIAAFLGYDENNENYFQKFCKEVDNHFFVFEKNSTSTPFVLPDAPVSKFRCSGYEKGYNYRMPITPWVQVLLVDPSSALADKVMAYRNRIRLITPEREDIISYWNKESFENSYRFIYYTPGYDISVFPENYFGKK